LIKYHLQDAEIYLKAKSYVVLGDRNTLEHPPHATNVDAIESLFAGPQILRAEYFGRNIAALGQCEHNQSFIML
jgi:hypothetical protein